MTGKLGGGEILQENVGRKLGVVVGTLIFANLH